MPPPVLRTHTPGDAPWIPASGPRSVFRLFRGCSKLKCICFLPQKSFTFVTMIPSTAQTLMTAACTSEHPTRINSFARLCTQVTRMKNSGFGHLAHSPRRNISCAWICGSLDDAGWGARVRGNRGMLLVDASPRSLVHAPSGVLKPAANKTTRAELDLKSPCIAGI